MKATLLLPLPLLLAAVTAVSAAPASFVIKDDAFVKDGQPFTLRSGSLHYFRVPPQYWADRMLRMKALGLNSVTMYVAWNWHEREEGQIQGLGNVTGFLDAAKQTGMLVILRPGPYICGEWEMGGLPAWLLGNQYTGMKLRTFDPQYIAVVDRWWNALLSAASPYSYAKGGPIVITQIENEYGSFGKCKTNPADAKYMNHLLALATTHLGAPMTEMLYSTIDGGEGWNSAKLEDGNPWPGDPRVLATVDGSLSGNYSSSFVNQKTFNAPGRSPKMWSELWVGWFTVWGDEHAANKSTSDFRNGVGEMVREDASFSLYMAHGGTNFGFWSGANGDENAVGKDSYKPDITSYDYSSPISEAGDHNVGSDAGDLFLAVKDAIAATPAAPEPPAVPKKAYGGVELTEAAALFPNLESLSTCHCAEPWADGKLPSFEDMKSWYGFMYYQTKGSAFAAKAISFDAKTLHDRVQVFVDGLEAGTAYRPTCPSTVAAPGGETMGLLVENMGRINYGTSITDYKGLLTPPPVTGHWEAYCLPMEPGQVQALPFETLAAAGGYATSNANATAGPVFRRGSLVISGVPADTFLDTAGFSKGMVWVNGQSLGRFWETAGPQHTLYVPAPFLKTGANEVIVLDLHGEATTAMHSVDRPRYS